jgi:hypothetical protein
VSVRCRLPCRALVAGLLTVVALVGQPGIGQAVPPPPPNPSDDDLKSSQSHVKATATRVGQLANQVAQADAALLALQSQVELKHELANKALIEQPTAAVRRRTRLLSRSRSRIGTSTNLLPPASGRERRSDRSRHSSARRVQRICSLEPSCSKL